MSDYRETIFWSSLCLAAAIIGWLIYINLDTDDLPPRIAEQITHPTPVPTVTIQVPTSGSLAEWEADLVNREKRVNEWIEHLQSREAAIKAVEEKCEL